ncbi:MAG: PHP domain-containing protein [Pirellulaceae bacterium]|nr:PHP domain-containing protein [Pirellulaceae bacterium]
MKPASMIRLCLLSLIAVVSSWIPSNCLAAEDAIDRLTDKRLAALRQAISQLATERKELPRSNPFRDYRANLHVHSLLSHDSRITLAEILVAAKKAGTEVLMFSEHPADHYDYFTDGHSGLRDGVLLIPGAEMQGMLVYPRQSVKGLDRGSVQEVSNLVRGRGGLTFLSHLEERMTLEVSGLTGNEIYNTHFDFKSEPRLLSALKNPLWWVRAGDLFKKYPQECMGSLQDYPREYLQRWDVLCQSAPHTGVSANDAHQNVGIRIRLADGNKAIVEDAVGEKVVEMSATLPLALGLKPYEVNGQQMLFETLLDPYEVSLRHVATHLLLRAQTVDEVWESLEQGRAYVSFDWLADPRGFDFFIESPLGRHEMGSQVAYQSELQLSAQAPLAGNWKLMRNGHLAEESDGQRFKTTLTIPGIYRVELWLKVADQDRIWILSNPIYVR